jgi:hypothetical protein
MSFDAQIKGLEAAQAAAVRAAAAVQPDGALGEAVRYATLAAHRYAVAHTVVDTGSWRASHRPEVRGAQGRIFIDPSAINPKSNTPPSVYGPELELRRGGRYAAYKTTVNEAGPQIVNDAGRIVEKALP